MASTLVPITTDSQVQLIAVPTVFSCLAATAIILRFKARRMANRKPEMSDWVIVASCIFNFALSGTVIAQGVVGGGGWHETDLVQEYGVGKIQLFLKIAIPVQILWAISLSLCKISILLLYAKVFHVKSCIIPAGITSVVIVLWMLATTLSALLICQPFHYTWGEGEGTCGNQVSSYLATGIVNIITDLVVITLPLPHLIRLEMALYKKVTLVCTFAAGLFTCIASAVRLQSITNINFEDVTASSAEAYVWSTIEPGLAITLACVPLLRPLLGGNYSPTGTALKGTYRLRDPGPGTQRWGPTFRGSKNDESSSEYQLRPVGPKNDTLITAGGSRTESRDERLSGENVESFATHSIGVKKEWKVTMNDPSR